MKTLAALLQLPMPTPGAPATPQPTREELATLAARERRDRLRASGVLAHLGPGDATRIARERLVHRPALSLVQRWAQPNVEQARWLLVAGPTDCGKTVAAGWLLARDGGRYVTMLELAAMFAPTMRGLAPQIHDEAVARCERIARVDTLVLDELGLDGPSPEIAREALHWLVERRYGRDRGRTLIMSNLSASMLRQRFASGTYNPRTESRLRAVLARDARTGLGVHEVNGAPGRGGPI